MTSRLILSVTTSLLAGLAFAQDRSADIASGNMHFDAKSMDSNGDGMVSKEEMTKYGEDMWMKMARATNVSIPVTDAANSFARGNLKFDAKSVDADGDGKITKAEFMKYGETKFDSMKKDSHGMISVSDAARDFGRGGTRPDY